MELTRAERAQARYMRAAGENGADQAASTARKWEKVSKNTNGVTASHSQASLPDGRQLTPLATSLLMGAGLLTLELANVATTFYALDNLMGGAGIWRASFAMLLTLGLATLDAGGLYRLFAPATAGETNRSFGLWCAMGAWLLTATTNAILTWHAVTVAMAGNVAGNAVLTEAQLLNVAPVFLALSLWLIRIMLVAGWAQGERG